MISEAINPNYLSCKFETFGKTKTWRTRALGRVKDTAKNTRGVDIEPEVRQNKAAVNKTFRYNTQTHKNM